MIGEGYFG